MLQSPNAGLQVNSQVPARQSGVAFARAGQRLAQDPQCATSSRSDASHPLISIVSQLSKPAAQASRTQLDARQSVVALLRVQLRRHPPQCAGATRVSTSQPLARLPSQSAKDAAHAVYPQAPLTHDAVALNGMHAARHMPQFGRLVRVSTSQPFAGMPSQSAKPVEHIAYEQIPLAHTAAALGGAHPRPHVPQ